MNGVTVRQQVTTEEECAEYSKWAMSNFQEWREWLEFHDSTDVVPRDLLDGKNGEALIKESKWLSLYVKETWHQDGKPFPSRTIDVLLPA